MAIQAFGAHEYEVAGVTSMEVICWEETPGVIGVVCFVQMGDNGLLVGSAITTAVKLTLVGFAGFGDWSAGLWDFGLGVGGGGCDGGWVSLVGWWSGWRCGGRRRQLDRGC